MKMLIIILFLYASISEAQEIRKLDGFIWNANSLVLCRNTISHKWAAVIETSDGVCESGTGKWVQIPWKAFFFIGDSISTVRFIERSKRAERRRQYENEILNAWERVNK